MPTDTEKVAAANLRLITAASADQIRSAALRAQEAGKRTMNSSIKVEDKGERHIGYTVRGPGGVVKIMSFELTWDAGDGDHAVVTTIGSFTTMRQRMFGFIPVGPTKVPALKSFEQFTAWMRKELSA